MTIKQIQKAANSFFKGKKVEFTTKGNIIVENILYAASDLSGRIRFYEIAVIEV